MEENCSYLVKTNDYNKKLYEVEIIKITTKAINLLFKRSDGTTYYEWISKEDFENEYIIFEKLPYPIQPIIKENIKISDSDCPICGGLGSIIDTSTTVGYKICPKCFGSGKI
ncbi:MAG: hypothetical protein U9Q27_01580 [Patescibacteria group bacterium]|nr:hypothetical protein [Patescibacteria group bacterium]